MIWEGLIMNAKSISQRLNKSVEVLIVSFEQLNLKVTSYGFCGIDQDGWMEFLVELTSTQGLQPVEDFCVKVNLYDSDNSILYSDSIKVDAAGFSGYDTIHFYLNEDRLAFDATKTRLYATRA